jgi:hypothetical protein
MRILSIFKSNEFYNINNLLVNSATILGSSSTAITLAAFSKSNAVRFPVPGPISRTVSVGLIPDLSTIPFKTFNLLNIEIQQG